jgi:integrase/recombinase XerD
MSFKESISECRCARLLSPKTTQSYQQSFNLFLPFLARDYVGADVLRRDLKKATMAISEAGKKSPSGINIAIRSLNSWLHWLHEEKYVGSRIIIKRLREPIIQLEVMSNADVAKWIRVQVEPGLEATTKMLVLFALDTGVRIAEALDLKRADVDWDNLLVKVMGKGRRQRTIPFSVELRRSLYRYANKSSHSTDADYLFQSRAGTRQDYQNVYDTFRTMNARLGIRIRKGFHTLRHTFATGFIRRGGDPFTLRRILGHSSIATTQRYVDLNCDDLQAKHRDHAKLLSL